MIYVFVFCLLIIINYYTIIINYLLFTDYDYE